MIVISPNTLPKVNQPTAGDCSKLIQYTDGAIAELNKVSRILNEISPNADGALVAIKSTVAEMISTAKGMKTNLQTIQKNTRTDYY